MTATQRALLNALRLALAGVAMGLAAGPLFLSDTQLSVLADFFSMLVLAILWNLLAGYADIVTIGQHAFVGVGAYAFYAFAALAGVDPYLSIPLAGVVALIIAVPTMALLFRLRTAYFSIGTWVVAEVMMLGAGKIEAFGGGSGISVPIEILRAFGSTRSGRLATIYWLGFVLAVFALGSTYLLLRSRFGVGLMAMRENEESAASVGVNVARARILCFLGVAPVLGITGALITLQKLRIAPQASFSIVDWSILITFIVVIGGIGTIEGPVLGTIFFFVLREYLSDLGTWHLILLGTFSIAIILIDRRGIWGLVRRFALPADLIPIAHRSSSENMAVVKRARLERPGR
jgi:branched-chain amino acid transport system permease protein